MDICGLPITLIKRITSLANSFAKELKITGTEKLSNDILVDAGINIIGEKIKNRISSVTGSGITLTNYEVKDKMKVIKSLENREILSNGTTKKIASQ